MSELKAPLGKAGFYARWALSVAAAMVFILTAQTDCLADSRAPASNSSECEKPVRPERSTAESTKEKAGEEEISWATPLENGPDTIYYFTEAISGKTFKPETYELLHGVCEVSIEKNKIIFRRVDNEELRFGEETERGAKFFKDWEKSKCSLESKFGLAGRDFLESIECVRVTGKKIEIKRRGPDLLVVEMGDRKLHHAFDLRGLRFRQLSMDVDHSGKHPFLKEIDGVSAVINAPGLSFPVEVKEFGKIRLEKVNRIRVGVSNPVPIAVRTILFLPAILRFNFELSRK